MAATPSVPREPARREPGAQHANVGSLERAVSVVTGSALTLYGLRRGGAGGLIAAAVGGVVAQRGLTGHCQIYGALGVNTAQPDADEAALPPPAPRALEMSASATVAVSPQETYERWRRFEENPRFMPLVESAEQLDERHSRWVARDPTGMSWKWDSELTDDRPGERIAWQTLPGADLPQTGSVEFRPAPGNRGTEVRMRLRIDPPLGPLGLAIGKLFGNVPDKMLREILRRFKQMVEAGEIATVEGQPSARA